MCMMNLSAKIVLSAYLIYSFGESLGNSSTTNSGNGSERVPNIEQTDINKELQKELNTLESRLRFVETTVTNFQTNFGVLKQNYDSLKIQFQQATARIQLLENATQQTKIEINDQTSKYSDLQNMNSDLVKTVDKTNVKLDNNTAVLSTGISNVTGEVTSISDMTNRNFASLRNNDIVLENKFLEISNHQSTIVSTLNQINKTRKVNITNSDQSHNSYKEYKIDSWANTDPWIYQRWDQVPRRSKHPLSTGPTGLQTPTLVVFVAKLSRDLAVSTRNIIIFNDIQLNEGRGFDPRTGVFTATTSGIYTISASIESTNRAVRAAIYRNSQPFAHISGRFIDRDGAMASATSYIFLDDGDRVWVQWMGDNNGLIGHVRSQFTGHLLSQTIT
ncbi:uncharacterized protein LOC125647898 isoform X1 [Ostrea edulis]|uniref:uncharacterized protein LOC125647898 isoform X1 n=1 Tax=Ostrea edulis TaxID=37623 RepID=UPI0024AF81E2|nr:uncharacterized protein LOC125647898 isoform X1 [Ostrea edulis]